MRSTMLRETEVVIESWRRHYNQVRPYASLGYRAPAPEVFVPALPAGTAAPLRPASPTTRVMTPETGHALTFIPDHPVGASQLLLIAGSDAGTKWHSDRAYALAKSEKELFVVPGGTHMSLYDRNMGKAMPKLLEFFGKQLEHPAS
jgi:fermentation-respiration switch protein FrsA (DUF1100 family)